MTNIEFTHGDLEALKRVLIREKATALSELRDAQRSASAYSDRAWAGGKVAEAQKRYDTAVVLLDIIGG